MRKFTAVLLSVLFLFTAALNGSINVLKAGAESLYIRKIVSVVYDDSGSMSYNGCSNWAYANYAMQAFCGLLNDEDKLFVTYMSSAGNYPNSYVPDEVDLSASGIQSSVNSIRNHFDDQGTPFWSLDIAYDKLRSVDDSNENTQYWLVVITDGNFAREGNIEVPEDDVNSKLASFSSSTMPNGSSPRITFLSIGEDIIKPKEDTANQRYVYSSAGANDIVKVMSEIADKVSGRSRLSPSDIVMKDPKTIEISSKIPLLNIAVLLQKTDAEIKSVKHSGGQKLEVTRQASLRYPEHFGSVTDKSLIGGTFQISDPSSNNIGTGTYTVEFSSDISLDNVVMMFEPALDIRMKYYKDGKEITDLSETKEGDKIEVGCGIYEIGTDNEISANLLPSDTVYGTFVKENGSVTASSNKSDMLLSGVGLHNTPTEITASVQIQGFLPITLSSGVFTPAKGVNYTVKVEPSSKMDFTLSELKNNTEKFVFTIYADGEKITKEQAESIVFEIQTDLAGSTKYEDDGTVSFTPGYRDPITANPSGDVEIKGVVQGGNSASGKAYVKPAEYTAKAIVPEDNELIRADLGDNEKGVAFEFYAEGEKLSKEAVEILAPEFKMNSPYDEKLKLEVTYNLDGSVLCVPKNEGWAYFAAFAVPTGDLDITSETKFFSETGRLVIGKDLVRELIFNYLIPGFILFILLGEIFKKRFKYSAVVNYNHAKRVGGSINGPLNGWVTERMFTLSAFVPFRGDRKNINGVTFYANGRIGSRGSVFIKPKKGPQFIGEISGSLNRHRPVHFSSNNVSLIDKEDKSYVLTYDDQILTSGSANFSVCQIFIYTDKK